MPTQSKPALSADGIASFIRDGFSRIDMARQLAPASEAGLTLRKLAADGFASSAQRPGRFPPSSRRSQGMRSNP